MNVQTKPNLGSAQRLAFERVAAMIVKEHRHERPKSQSCGSFNDAILTDVKFLDGPVYGGRHVVPVHWVRRDNLLRRVRNFSCFRSTQAWGLSRRD
jgi:hypothetical protein